MKQIVINETGGPEVLSWQEATPGPLAGGALRIRLGAAGLNFIDTYHRTGLYPVSFPFVPGIEGSGTVEAAGDDTEGFEVGDRVAWANGPGSYSEVVDLAAEAAVKVPDDLDLDSAAAVMLQGMTAHYLCADTYPLAAGDKCLIHAGAGGVGLLLIQLAKLRGAEVFATVGSADKAALAAGAGADHVIDYNEVDFGEAVEATAGPKPLHVVYDGVGKSVFMKSLDLLRPRGMMVTFGNASGPVDPISPLELSRRGSLFLTRPTLFHHIADRADLLRRANYLFAWMASGDLDVRIGHRIPLRDAGEAHRMLEARQTTGKVLLIP